VIRLVKMLPKTENMKMVYISNANIAEGFIVKAYIPDFAADEFIKSMTHFGSA